MATLVGSAEYIEYRNCQCFFPCTLPWQSVQESASTRYKQSTPLWKELELNVKIGLVHNTIGDNWRFNTATWTSMKTQFFIILSVRLRMRKQWKHTQTCDTSSYGPSPWKEYVKLEVKLASLSNQVVLNPRITLNFCVKLGCIFTTFALPRSDSMHPSLTKSSALFWESKTKSCVAIRIDLVIFFDSHNNA